MSLPHVKFPHDQHDLLRLMGSRILGGSEETESLQSKRREPNVSKLEGMCCNNSCVTAKSMTFNLCNFRSGKRPSTMRPAGRVDVFGYNFAVGNVRV